MKGSTLFLLRDMNIYIRNRPPKALVVHAANQQERQSFQGPSPKNKEGKRLNLFGRKAYSTGGLQFRIANQQAIVSGYTQTCAVMAKLVELLP